MRAGTTGGCCESATHYNTLRNNATHLQHTATTLQHTTKRYNTPQHTAKHTAKHLEYTATTLYHTATHCNTLPRTATHSTILQHPTTLCTYGCNHSVTGPLRPVHHNTPHYAATHRNTPQHTATHRNTPQHTASHHNHTTVTPHHTTLQHTATHCNKLHLRMGAQRESAATRRSDACAASATDDNFSKVSALLNLLLEMTSDLTFEKFR